MENSLEKVNEEDSEDRQEINCLVSEVHEDIFKDPSIYDTDEKNSKQRELSKFEAEGSNIEIINDAESEEYQTKPSEKEIPINSEENCNSHDIKKISNRSKHKTVFQSEWTTKHPWLKCDAVKEKEVLFCQLCTKHLSTIPTYSNSPWIKNGFATVRLDKVKSHADTEMHNRAVEAETAEIKIRDRAEECINEDSETYQAIEGAMKCLYFLIEHNIPHTTIFKPFIDFCINELQSPILAPLKKAKNASYTSHRIQSEFITAMATVQNNEILTNVNISPSYSLLIDETTDINNRKHLAIAAKYLKDGKTQISFIKDLEILDGKADTIFSALETEIEKCGGIGKMSGFGSDGASVMIGHKDGVASKLKRKNNKIISIHCHNHRLALATKDTFESINSLARMDETLTGLYKYYKNSAVRSSSLREIQNILSTAKGTKIKKAAHTRWLSHENALNSIRVNMEALILDLENATVAKQAKVIQGISGPTAEGLLKIIKRFDFFVMIHFLCDVLAVISKLTLTFERRDIALAVVESQVASTISALERLKRKPGGAHCRNIEKRAREIGIIVTEEEQKKFELNAKLFIDTLTKNIMERLDNLPIVTMLGIFDLSNYANGNIFYGTSEMSELAEFYNLDEDDLLEEWDKFKSLFHSEDDSVKNQLTITYLIKALLDLEQSIGENFPNIKKLLSIANTLPVSTAEVERIFSQVKLILSNHRNRLKVENVDNIISIKCNGPLSITNAVKYWLNQKHRKLMY